MTDFKKFNILGVDISAISFGDACFLIEEYINSKKKGYICTCPVNTILECRRNAFASKSLQSATLVTPDGIPVVWLGKLNGHKNMARVYGPDLMLEICRISNDKGYKNYFYGSTSEVLSKLSANLKFSFPDLTISGMYSPPFHSISSKEDAEIIEEINKSNSDILWVGLGSPKQDIWMYEHRDKLNVPIVIGVGAAFDFIAGTKKQAPKWMQRSGLEWLFRLATEPGRLWKRYILGNMLFLYLLLKEFIVKRK